MQTLSAADTLVIWERGQGRHPLDQALAILSVACPERAPAELAALSIGRRDTLLLDLYERSFGPQMAALADCLGCGETLELAFDLSTIRAAPAGESAGEPFELCVEGYRLRFRLPNSFDLAQIAGLPERSAPGAARVALLRSCLLELQLDGQAIAPAELPAALAVALAARMAELDPQADVLLATACPVCGQQWQPCFDIVTFLWARLRARAHSLLSEIHTIARAYGWREAEIIALSAARRQHYLDLLI